MEATIKTKMIGKDELKGWMIAQITKPLPEQRYRKLNFEFCNVRNGFNLIFLSLIRELTNGSIHRPTVSNCLVTLPMNKSIAKSPLWYY